MKSKLFLACMGAAISLPMQATLAGEFSVNGFASASVGWLNDDQKNAAGDRLMYTGIDNQVNFSQNSLLGLQMGYDFDNTDYGNWGVVAQILAKGNVEKSADSNWELGASWMFLRWEPTDYMQLKIGRARTPFFLLSEYLDVGYAYPWISPPAEVYTQIPTSNFDGLQTTFSGYLTDDWMASMTLFAGSNNNSQADGTGHEVINFRNTVGVNVSIENDWLMLRAGYAQARFTYETPDIDNINTAISAPCVTDNTLSNGTVSQGYQSANTGTYGLATGATLPAPETGASTPQMIDSGLFFGLIDSQPIPETGGTRFFSSQINSGATTTRPLNAFGTSGTIAPTMGFNLYSDAKPNCWFVYNNINTVDAVQEIAAELYPTLEAAGAFEGTPITNIDAYKGAVAGTYTNLGLDSTTVFATPQYNNPDTANYATVENELGKFYGVGYRLEYDNFLSMGEWTQRRTDTVSVASSQGWYVMLAYRFDMGEYGSILPNFTYANRSVLDNRRDGSPYGANDADFGLAQAYGTVPASAAFQQAISNSVAGDREQTSYTFGLRWDFMPAAALKAQYTLIHPNNDTTGLFNFKPDSKNVSLYQLALNVVF